MTKDHGSTGLLEVDRNFTACPVECGDELYANGIFVFNITRILKYIADAPDAVELVQIAVSDYPAEFSSIDESHVESVDISRPVVLAEIAPGQHNVVDGNHRMEKARRLGVTTVSAFKLGVRQHTAFLTSQEAYFSYVEYWNDKIRGLDRKESRTSRRNA
jgi:hypothetical protein